MATNINKLRLGAIIISLFFLSSAYAQVIAEGKCGEDVKWSIDSDYTLTISGHGDMDSISSKSEYWKSYLPEIKRVIIKDGITSICNNAFWLCCNLKEVSIPKSVKTIGACAFADCEQLTNLVIPDSVKDFSRHIFGLMGNNHLKHIELGESITSIDDSLFMYCEHLESVKLGNSVTSIGSYAFCDCSKLRSINLAKSIVHIGPFAFSGCTSLATNTQLPEFLISIGEGAFWDSSSPQSIIIGTNIKEIGKSAFKGIKVKSITVSENNKAYKVKGNIIYTKAIDTLIYCAQSKSGKVIIPDDVKYIEENAFFGCRNISAIHLGKSVSTIGLLAFYDCNKLKRITVDSQNLHFCAIDGILYSREMDTLYLCANKSIKEVSIPESVKFICKQAFRKCKNLKKIRISESVIFIDTAAFEDCVRLDTAYLPEAVEFYSNIFKGCSKQLKVYSNDGTRLNWKF